MSKRKRDISLVKEQQGACEHLRQCGEVFIPGRMASEVNRLANRVIEDVEIFAKSQPQTQNGSRSKEIAIAV